MHVDVEFASSKAPQRGGDVEVLELRRMVEGEKMKRINDEERARR